MFTRLSSGGGGSGVKYYETTIANATADTSYSITCGFTPKQIFIYEFDGGSSNLCGVIVYDADVNAGYQISAARISSTLQQCNVRAVTDSGTINALGQITSVNSTGFVYLAKNIQYLTKTLYIKVLG